MARFQCVAVSLIFSMLLAAAPVLAVEIEGRVNRVGLFAGATPIIRPGVWSFVEVELRTRAAKPFEGRLHIEQIDRDGDVMTSVLPVALAPNGDWRPYEVYFVPYDQHHASNVRVRLYDAQGRQISLLDETGVEVRDLPTNKNLIEISADEYLIVDLTTPRRLPHVAWLDCNRLRATNRINARHVRSMAPRELPHRAHGLEAVDAIVWDDADPAGLDGQQMSALIEWVRGGGRLLITAGKHWQTLAGSPLDELLPVHITGLTQAQEVQEFLDLVPGEDYRAFLDARHHKRGVMRCMMSPRIDALPMPTESLIPPMAYRRLLGRGSLVFVGASLMELMPPPTRLNEEEDADVSVSDLEEGFLTVGCERVVASRLLSLPAVQEEEIGTMSIRFLDAMREDLYEGLRRTIGFESVGGAFLLFAIAFALLYTLSATTGSYFYMKKHAWEHHAWSAFAVVALVGSVLSTGMVWALRGFSTQLWQTTFVDARAGSSEAQAFALFGVKSPDHERIDLRLPLGESTPDFDAAAPLRVVSRTAGFDRSESRFVASDRYVSQRNGNLLEDVPLRATLKEFEASWHGPLAGTVEGLLVAHRNTSEDADRIKYEFGVGSYLNNKLEVDLRDCLLVAMPVDSDEEVAGERPVVGCHCFRLGDLPRGASLTDEQLNQMLYSESGTSGAGDSSRTRVRRLPLLSDSLIVWSNQLVPIGLEGGSKDEDRKVFTPQQEYARLLLVSLFNLTRQAPNLRRSFSRSQARPLDCSHLLTRRTALLLAWSDRPAPPRLEKNLIGLRPERSLTIYRFLLPVEKK